MSDTDQKQAHLQETTEARLHQTTSLLHEVDIKVREARTRHETADVLFATARDLHAASEANLNRTVSLRRRLNSLDLLAILLVILLATHVI